MAITGNFADAIARFIPKLSDDVLVHKLTSAPLELQALMAGDQLNSVFVSYFPSRRGYFHPLKYICLNCFN